MNIDRLTRLAFGTYYTLPSGLSREEKRQFIIDCSNGLVQPSIGEPELIYQMIVKALLERKRTGTDIGLAIKYCTDNAFDLVQKYEEGSTVPELVKLCLANK